VDAHRGLGTLQLESILSFVGGRKVANDYTIAWEGGRWQIPREQIRAGLRDCSIRVEQCLDGAMIAWVGRISFPLQACLPRAIPTLSKTKRPARRFIAPPGTSRRAPRCVGRRDASQEAS